MSHQDQIQLKLLSRVSSTIKFRVREKCRKLENEDQSLICLLSVRIRPSIFLILNQKPGFKKYLKSVFRVSVAPY